MSSDKKFFSSNKSDNSSTDEWADNPSKTLLAEMEEERIRSTRKDIIVYKLLVQKVIQAVAIIVFIIMLIDSIFYLTFWSPHAIGANWALSWLLFIQAGFLLIVSGTMISKTSRIEKRRTLPQGLSSTLSINLKFAFFHSLTWFISGIIIAILSYVIFYTVP